MSMKFQDFIIYLETEKRYSSHTVLAFKTDLQQFSVYLEGNYEVLDMKEASFPMVRSFVVDLMEKEYKPKSVNRKLSSLKTYFNFLRKKGIIVVNPAAKITSLKTPKQLVKTVSLEEMQKLLLEEGVFADTHAGIRDRAIIELLYATGIRRSELIELKLNGLDFNAYTIKVTGKRNKTRVIPFPKSIAKSLIEYQNIRPNNENKTETFFLTEKGNKLDPKLVYNVVKQYLSLVTTSNKKSPHVLRHTYATHLLNKGADVNDIKELLGHSSLNATQIYTHNSFEKLKEAYNQTHPREHKKK